MNMNEKAFASPPQQAGEVREVKLQRMQPPNEQLFKVLKLPENGLR